MTAKDGVVDGRDMVSHMNPISSILNPPTAITPRLMPCVTANESFEIIGICGAIATVGSELTRSSSGSSQPIYEMKSAFVYFATSYIA